MPMNNPKPRIAFIGLGTMGFAMATNLYRAGFSLAVWNRSDGRAHNLVRQFAEHKQCEPREGADKQQYVRAENILANVILDAEIILYSLADNEAIEQVVFSQEGILSTVSEGQLFINLSTVHPDMSRREAAAYEKRGAGYLDAPAFGSLPEAQAADLCLVLGGKKQDSKRAEPVLKAISSTRYHVGDTGKGASMGLIGSLMVCLQLQALGEGLTLAQKAGLDVKEVVEILGVPDFRSPIFCTMGADVLQRRFDAVFSLKHLYKDANQILQLANQLNVVVPGCAAAHEVIKSAMTHGWGNENASAMIKALERQSNTKIQQRKPNTVSQIS